MASPKIHIKTISAEKTHLVRHPVLRTGLPIESCVLPGDELSTTIHLGAYHHSVLKGVCTLLCHPKDGPFQVPNGQIRGMAVLPSSRRRGLGRLLLEEAERRGKMLYFEILWMNARLEAFDFYASMGYKIDGAAFDVPLFGPHYRMKKSIL